MAVERNAVLHQASDALAATVGGQLVLLSPRDLSYHAVDAVGADIWRRTETPTTMDDIVSDLVCRYDVSEEQCRHDVSAFIERMRDIGVIECS